LSEKCSDDLFSTAFLYLLFHFSIIDFDNFRGYLPTKILTFAFDFIKEKKMKIRFFLERKATNRKSQ